jgi:hypothetical protein
MAELTLKQQMIEVIAQIQSHQCNQTTDTQISFNWVINYPTKPFESYVCVMSCLDGDRRKYDQTLTSDSESGLLAALLLELNHLTQPGVSDV